MNIPRIPQNVSPYARACLEAIASANLGQHISLGGAFGLAHYLEYRATHDIDAWWNESATAKDMADTIDTVMKALREFGGTRVRSWGEVSIVELETEGKIVFSFQVAHRSALLQKPLASPWAGGVRVDRLEDLVAAKMTALVERGAPRDFRDIHAICGAGLCSVSRCWELWEERQALAREDKDARRARIAIGSHLARLEASRPLEGIPDPESRGQASRLRAWFEEDFLREH